MKLRNIKTGEIIDLARRGLLKSDNDNHIIIYPEGALKYYVYNSLAELNEEWEEYKPAEPLIKDEKIRKAVRAWAEACKIESDDAIMISDLAPAFTRFYTSMYEIDIKTESSLGLDEHKDYTIAELCGEEEE